MKHILEKLIITLLLASMLLTMAACGSSEPCSSCRSTPTKGYNNDYTGEKEYYCSRCSSDCEFCSGEAGKSATILGQVVFICDDCSDELGI